MSTLHQRSPNVNGASFSGSISPNDDIVHFCHVAALIVTVYDHLITLDYEVEYIWKKNWSKSKLLYILARYFGDILLISICVVFLNREASYMFTSLSCAVGLKFVGTGSMVIIIITQMIMQLRIKALYGTTISNLITAIWVMEVTAVISLGIASLAAIDVHPVILNTTTMCNPTYLPRYAFLFWVPVIVFESFLFSLALRIAYQNYKEIGTWRGASLLYIVLRDNFSFFVCAFALYIITATTWLTADPRYFTVPGSFSCSLTTIMGSRLILNLCEAYHHPPDPNATPPPSIWAAATSGNIQFLSLPRARAHATTSGSTNTKSVASQGWTRHRWRRADAVSRSRDGNGNGGGDGDGDTRLGVFGTFLGGGYEPSSAGSGGGALSEVSAGKISKTTNSGVSMQDAEEHELIEVGRGGAKEANDDEEANVIVESA